MLKNNASVNLSFELMEGVKKYTVYALCDSYLGCDQMEDIDVEVQNQDEEE